MRPSKKTTSIVRRRSALAAGAAAATLLLAACGSGTTSAGSAGSSASAGTTEISFWTGMNGPLGDELQKLITQFNDSHPGIHVTPTYQGSYSGGGQEQQKLLAAIAAHQVPDIAQIEVDSMPSFEASGALLPLDSMIGGTTDPKNMLPGMNVSTQYEGKTYGVPFNRSVALLYYNKDMLDKAGIAKAPDTWDELDADVKKLTSGTGSNKVYGFSPEAYWWDWQSIVWAGGGEILTPDLKKAAFTTPEATKILKMQQQEVIDGDAIVQSGADFDQLTTASFTGKKVAMYEESSGGITAVDAAMKGTNWGTAMMPKDVARAVPPGGADAVLMQGISPEKQKAAMTFIQWFTDTPQTIAWSEATGYLPLQKAALSDPAYQAYVKAHPQNQAALDEVGFQKQPPESPQYFNVLETVQNGLADVFSNKTPVDQAMAKTADQVNQALDR